MNIRAAWNFSARKWIRCSTPAGRGRASALIAKMSFDPARLNRLAWQHGHDSARAVGGRCVSDTLVSSPGRKMPATAAAAEHPQLGVLDAALLTLDGGNLHPAVAAQWRAALGALAQQLAFEQRHVNTKTPAAISNAISMIRAR